MHSEAYLRRWKGWGGSKWHNRIWQNSSQQSARMYHQQPFYASRRQFQFKTIVVLCMFLWLVRCALRIQNTCAYWNTVDWCTVATYLIDLTIFTTSLLFILIYNPSNCVLRTSVRPEWAEWLHNWWTVSPAKKKWFWKKPNFKSCFQCLEKGKKTSAARRR